MRFSDFLKEDIDLVESANIPDDISDVLDESESDFRYFSDNAEAQEVIGNIGKRMLTSLKEDSFLERNKDAFNLLNNALYAYAEKSNSINFKLCQRANTLKQQLLQI